MVILSFGGGAEGEHICNGLTVAETDGRLLAVRARFSRGWNFVDFLMYLIGYL